MTMKKMLNKIIQKVSKNKKEALPNRITSETVAEHREQILAGGRKFKYPIQYAKHRLVINAVIISVVFLIVISVVGWWQLYVVQNTSSFMYSITKVVPVPVASVDGRSVLYSDYLTRYIGSIHYAVNKEQLNVDSEDGKRRAAHLKQQSIDDVIAETYAAKLAKDMDISISDNDFEIFLVSQRQANGVEMTEVAYQAVVLEYYGWNYDEYRHEMKSNLLRQKVSYEMDKDAIQLANEIYDSLKNNPNQNLKTLAEQTPNKGGSKATYGVSGWVPKSNQDGGRTAEAAKLEKNQISSVIKSTNGSGYYVVKLLDINDKQVSYEYIEIPLTAFESQLKNIISDNKVKKYITIQ